MQFVRTYAKFNQQDLSTPLDPNDGSPISSLRTMTTIFITHETDGAQAHWRFQKYFEIFVWAKFNSYLFFSVFIMDNCEELIPEYLNFIKVIKLSLVLY